MKMFKRSILILIISGILLTAAGCSENQPNDPANNTPEITASAAPDESSTSETVPSEIPIDIYETTAETEPSDETTPPESSAGGTNPNTDDPVDENTAKELIEEAMEKRLFIEYRVFRGGFNRNESEDLIYTAETGSKYAPVEDDECPFSSVQDIKDYINGVFTENYTALHPFDSYFEGDYPMYIDHDGKLYMIMGDGGGAEFWAYDNMEITELAPGKISAKLSGQDSYESQLSAEMTIVNTQDIWKIEVCDILW